MAARAPIIAGKTVILLQVQDTVDSALAGVKKKLNKFSASIGNISLDLFRGGIVGSLPLIAVGRDFQAFEDRILFLRTKLETTEPVFAKVEQRIRDLGRTTSFTAQEVADGATQLAQAGFNAAELINTLEPVLDLARGAQIGLSDSAAILANTLRVFNLETTKASEVASQFILAARKGTLTVLDLKESLKEVVGTLSVLNIDLPTSLALVTQLAQSSLRGTKAGTSLNTALLNLAKNSDVLKSALNIDAVDAAGNLRPFISVLDELLLKLEPLGNARRVAVIQRLFNIRGGRAITGLLRDLGRTREIADEIKNAGDEARKAAVLMDSGFGGAIRRATSALGDLSITLGKLISGPITTFLNVVPALANSLEQLAKANPNLVLAIAAIPPVMLAAGAAGLTLSFALSKIAAVVGTLSSLFGFLGSTINSAVTQQLSNALRLFSAFKQQASKLNNTVGLSVLGAADPAKTLAAQKRVAKATAALRKAQLGSSLKAETKAAKALANAQQRLARANKGNGFLGRIGKTKVPIVAPIEAVAKSIAKSVSRGSILSNFAGTYFNTGAFKYFAKTRISPIASAIGKTATAIGKKGLRSTNFTKSLATVSSAGASLLEGFFAGPKAFSFAGFNVAAKIEKAFSFLGNANATPPFLNGFLKIGSVITSTGTKIGASVAAIGTTIQRSIAFAWGWFGNPDVTPPFLNILTKTLPSAISSASKALSFVSFRGASIVEGGFAKVPGLLAKGFSLLGTILRGVATGGLKLFVAAWNVLKRIDLVKILFNTAVVVKNLVLVISRLGLVAFKTLTTLSGWGNIITVLLIIGPKIEFIRKAFERLGKGISNAFSVLLGTFDDIRPALALLSTGFKSIFSGEGTTGVEQLVSGLKAMATIVKSNLIIAFNELKFAVAPLFDFIRTSLLSILELGKLIGSLFGVTFSNIGSGIQAVTGGGAGSILGSITSAIKEAFSPESIKAAFSFVGTVFAEMAKSVNFILGKIFEVVNFTMSQISRGISALFDVLLKTALTLTSALPQTKAFDGIRQALFLVAGNVLEPVRNSFRDSYDAQESAANSIKDTFKDAPKAIDGVLNKFLANLSNIFKTNTAGDAIKDSAIAFSDRLAAAEFAERQARGQADSLAFKAGTILGNPFQALANVLPKLTTLLPQKVDPKQGSFLEFGKVIAQNVAQAAQSPATIIGALENANVLKRRDIGDRAGKIQNLTELITGTEAVLNGPTTEQTANKFTREILEDLVKEDKAKLNLLKTADRADRLEIKDRQARIADLKAGLRLSRQGTQVGDIRDVVAATVGSIQSTRLNKFRVDDTGKKTTDLLEGISAQLGPGVGADPYLKQLVDKATPLTFK